ncbi:MAG: glycosyltransferase, partial [Planctomycetota bacterium]|nr:glycosyltransferase [Planctomycetota bacterium]
RAGATTLAEISTAGRAVILVPYPHATDDHQRANAEWFVCRGAARMVLETNGVASFRGGLVGEMDGLLGSSRSRWQLANAIQRLARPDAAQSVVDVLEESLGGYDVLKLVQARAA